MIFLIDLVPILLPQFDKSVLIAKLLLINSYLNTIPLHQVLILQSVKIKKQNLLNISSFSAGIINSILSIAMIKIGYGIIGVAIATIIANFVLYSLHFIFSHKYYMTSLSLGFYFKTIIPIIVLFSLLLIEVTSIKALGIFSLITIISFAIYTISYRKELIYTVRQLKLFIKNYFSLEN
tara:strand:+ start:1070 stop:1606 length:537 start_codon:yes stop_codon:yes gene_type:complete